MKIDRPAKDTGSRRDAEKVVPLPKRVLAEFIGTFMLVFAAAGADVADAVGGHELGRFAVAAAPGFAVAAMIYATDKISGAYFNPATSIGFVLTGHLKLKDLPFYVAAQIVAAIAAALVVAYAIGQSGTAGLTLPHTDWLQSFAIETVFTFMLMFTGLSLKEEVGYKAFGGIAIAAVIVATGIIGASVSGASMNPARSFGPALVALNFSDQWIYWVAPLIGMALAVFSFRAIEPGKKQ
jgi:MIP family channel proteins